VSSSENSEGENLIDPDNKRVRKLKNKTKPKFSTNSALKLHQKLFLKMKDEKKKKISSHLEKLLTPFTTDKLLKADPFADKLENHSEDDDDEERDSSEVREKEKKQKSRIEKIAIEHQMEHVDHFDTVLKDSQNVGNYNL
jgi:hypothetical protein